VAQTGPRAATRAALDVMLTDAALEQRGTSRFLQPGAAAKALAGHKLDGDEQIGLKIIARACEEPLRQIVLNAGLEGAVVVEKVRESSDPHFGYNAATGKYEDLIAAGVIDPTKVTRTALQNAASIASLMLTTEAMISELPERKSASPAGHPGEGMDY
jgi:chaperonin GroEL